MAVAVLLRTLFWFPAVDILALVRLAFDVVEALVLVRVALAFFADAVAVRLLYLGSLVVLPFALPELTLVRLEYP